MRFTSRPGDPRTSASLSDSYLAGLDPAGFGQRWEAALGDDTMGSTVMVVLGDDRVLAMCAVGPLRGRTEPDDPTGELWMLNADPSAFGTGAAVALHAAALQTLIEQGHRSAALWVVDRNPRARRFYEREGWAADGVERDEEFGGSPIHELRYVRDLRKVSPTLSPTIG